MRLINRLAVAELTRTATVPETSRVLVRDTCIRAPSNSAHGPRSHSVRKLIKNPYIIWVTLGQVKKYVTGVKEGKRP